MGFHDRKDLFKPLGILFLTFGVVLGGFLVFVVLNYEPKPLNVMIAPIIFVVVGLHFLIFEPLIP